MPGCHHDPKVYSGESEHSEELGMRQYEWICISCLEEGVTQSALPVLGTIRHFVELKLRKDPNDAWALGKRARLNERPQGRSFWQRMSEGSSYPVNPPDDPFPIRFTEARRRELTEEIEQIRREVIEYTESHQEMQILSIEPNRIEPNRISIDSEATLMPTREEE